MKRLALACLVWLWAGAPAAAGDEPLDRCLAERELARVARVLDPGGRIVYARVTGHEDGHITRAATLAPNGTPLAEVFAKAAGARTASDFPVDDEEVCAVVDLPESALDAEERVIVSTGLNFAAHAEEAGGGDVFLFPKPSAPTRPYAPVHAPAGVTLLDYEVELAFVLLEDVDPFAPPAREALLAKSAFFLSNDVSDREAIVRNAAFTGTGTGFAEGKGQPGFLPAGPWMIRGSELFEAMEDCGSEGLRLRLWVDVETEPRQSASSELMILPPAELVARIGTWIEERGRRSSMPFLRPGETEPRFYPLAVPQDSPRLTAGSIVQTGTPEGVALNAPSPLGVTLRGAIRLRSPFQQFLVEEKERVAAGGTKYLAPGSVVRARISGLGAQRFPIGAAGGRAAPHPCDGGAES
ncbi:MAG: fumarylacetoacetate hydrolase family protein [Myxococcota bacterium]|nr:fumarylacetoacetate hydrolase family protein [Myxococcota bacterium]